MGFLKVTTEDDRVVVSLNDDEDNFCFVTLTKEQALNFAARLMHAADTDMLATTGRGKSRKND